MDVINGMRDGPHGQLPPSASSGGMSPLTMGLLALLAYKAFKGGSPLGNIFGGNAGAVQQSGPGAPFRQPTNQGGLGDLLGGLFGAGAAGTMVSGGLNELIRRLQQNGQGNVARSWVGTGNNEP